MAPADCRLLSAIPVGPLSGNLQRILHRPRGFGEVRFHLLRRTQMELLLRVSVSRFTSHVSRFTPHASRFPTCPPPAGSLSPRKEGEGAL
jgi:hypothetical protein